MIADIARALRDVLSPGLRGWALLGIALAIATLLALFAVIQLVLGGVTDTGYVWLDWILRGLGALGSAVAAWFLFPATASLVFGLLLERIVDAVERTAYPQLPAPRTAGLGESVGMATRLGLLALALNLLVIPLYLIPGLNLLVALLLNGYLIGREYFETVAARRMSLAAARGLRRQHAAAVLVAGMVVAALLLIPFVNLVAPVIGATFLTHRYHGLKDRR